MSAPNTYRADSVAYWAVQGGAGWLNVLYQLQRDGLAFPDQMTADLLFVRAVLDNVIAVASGAATKPLPGGASGALARHFPQSP